MTIVEYPYEHFLFYDDQEKAQKALEHVMATLDTEAELYSPPITAGDIYMIVFATSEEFTRESVNPLLLATDPDEYDLNNIPEETEWEEGDL